MRKIVCVLVLACVIMGAAFAQQGAASAEKKNVVSLDAFPLIKGIIASNDDFTDISVSLAYERLIQPHYSIGANIEFYNMDVDGMDEPFIYFSLAAEGRYYPSANFDKFFVGAALGFSLVSYDGDTDEEDGGFAGLYAALKFGYKIVAKNFVMEPSMGYVLSKNNGLPTPLG